VKDGKLVPMAINVGGKTEKIAAAEEAPAAAPAGESKMGGEMKSGGMKKDEKKQ